MVYAKIHAKKEKERDKKEREKVNKKRRKGVEQFFPHTRNDSLNTPRTPVNRLHERDKNFFCLFNILFNTPLRKTNQKDKKEKTNHGGG